MRGKIAWKGQGQMRANLLPSGSVGIWRASGPLRPYKFSHGCHIIGILGKGPVHSGGIERNIDALDQGDGYWGASALQGMSHPSILAKQDRLETDIESEDSWAPPY